MEFDAATIGRKKYRNGIYRGTDRGFQTPVSGCSVYAGFIHGGLVSICHLHLKNLDHE
jgi:hypothetical protein